MFISCCLVDPCWPQSPPPFWCGACLIGNRSHSIATRISDGGNGIPSLGYSWVRSWTDTLWRCQKLGRKKRLGWFQTCRILKGPTCPTYPICPIFEVPKCSPCFFDTPFLCDVIHPERAANFDGAWDCWVGMPGSSDEKSTHMQWRLAKGWKVQTIHQSSSIIINNNHQ